MDLSDGDHHEVPTLRVDGLVLRPFTQYDVAQIIEVSHDPEIPLVNSLPRDVHEEAARVWVVRQQARVRDGVGFPFAITDAESGALLGQIGLWRLNVGPGRASIGYWVLEAYRRRGIATTALTAVAEWGLGTLRLDRLELYVEPWNKGSWRTAERAGFHREGLLRSWEPVGDERRDMYMYSRLPTD